MSKIFRSFIYIFSFLMISGFLISLGVALGGMQPQFSISKEDSILLIELEGIILDGEEVLEQLRTYAKKDQIKGVLIKINSPGGVVGPSQEIYSEIRRIRDELQKPVVVTCSAVAASGAYYAAVGASYIFTNPGTMVGSIGVIMEFANLKDLYQWAKIDRYVLKTGQYKDAGADYRQMTLAEQELFQEMIDQVHEQFKLAIIEGRKLSRDLVDKYADGRIFTGEAAVKLGFADQVGTYHDALLYLGEQVGLGDDPKIFTPPKSRDRFIELLMESVFQNPLAKLQEKILNKKLLGKPLFLMPSAVGL